MDSHKNGGDVLILEDPKKLQKLARLLWNNEWNLMSNIQSLPQRVKYLNDCKEVCDKTISLIDDVDKMYKKYLDGNERNETKANIAKDVVDYIKYSANMCMQNVRNCSLRLDCIKKIEAEYEIVKNRLKKLDDKNLTDVRSLAEEVTMSKQCMLEYTRKCRSQSARALSKNYSMAIKQEGITFQDLIEREKNKLGYKDPFSNLEEIKKLEVYNNIIEAAGRKLEFPKVEKMAAKIGVGISVMASAMTVWDIYMADHQLEALVSSSLNTLAVYGANALKVVAQATLTAMEVASGVVTVVTFAASVLAGLVLAPVVDWLVDYIFNSGGRMAPTGLNDYEFYAVKIPDGMVFAHQISHDDDD